MEIILAKNSGFCFGVEMAIEKAYNLAKSTDNEVDSKIYTYGPLIHNKRVIRDLEDNNIMVTNSLDDISAGDKIIIRSHGVGENIYELAENKNLKVIDATCPYVKKIHNLVKKAAEKGDRIIIFGDESHPEIKGVLGWSRGRGIVVADVNEFIELLDYNEEIINEKLLLVAQTTSKLEAFQNIVNVIVEKNLNCKIENTICSATKMRQDGCIETAKKVDLMIVVGDNKSSNSKKLYELAQKYCKNSYFIENIMDLPLKEIKKYNRIGVAAGASTPEYAIKEVITKMSEDFTREESMLDYMEEIEKSLRLPKSGELVHGIVHQVTEDFVIVNLGVKKDGIIPFSEVSLEEGKGLKDTFKEGEEIEAKVLKTDDGDGTILLSRRKLEISTHWAELVEAYENKEIIEAEVTRQVNGGVIAMYKEVQGFIPLSQLSDRYIDDSSEFIGKTLEVKVSKVDQRRSKAVFSRKVLLTEERQKVLDQIWEHINVGDIVEGVVKRFTDYGAFVDIGGVDGLLHISEISWGKLRHPKEVLKLEEKIQVKILSMNSEKGKISLGLKQTKPEPWSVIDEVYTVGQVVEGKLVQIKEYGCFVEIEPGLDGLVHISEINHHRVTDINDELKLGDVVQAKILEIDKERKRISLSIKATIEPSEEDLKVLEESEETPLEENISTENKEECTCEGEGTCEACQDEE